MRRSDKRAVREVAALAHEAIELVGETRERTSEQTSKAMEVARLALRQAQDATALAQRMSDILSTVPQGEVLSGAALQEMAEAVPQWSITSGIIEGKAVKSFSRTITEEELPPARQYGGALYDETYRQLGDVEYSDLRLASFFDSYHVVGRHVNSKYWEITVHSDNPGPIVYDDFARVLDAEQYLHDAGYVQAVPEEAITTA